MQLYLPIQLFIYVFIYTFFMYPNKIQLSNHIPKFLFFFFMLNMMTFSKIVSLDRIFFVKPRNIVMNNISRIIKNHISKKNI